MPENDNSRDNTAEPASQAGARRVTFGPLSMAIFLTAPVAVVGVIVWIIIASLGAHTDGPQPSGAGAGDTGGANAIGEMLAGNDPERIESDNQQRRRGELRSPWDWPAGFTVTVHDRALGLSSEDTALRPELILWPGPGTPDSEWIRVPFEPRPGGRWAATVGPDRIDAFTSLAQGTAGGGQVLIGVGQIRAVGEELRGPRGPLRPISIDEGSREVRLPHETSVSLTTRDHESDYKRVTMADLMTECNYLNPDVEVIAEINTPASFETFAARSVSTRSRPASHVACASALPSTRIDATQRQPGGALAGTRRRSWARTRSASVRSTSWRTST